jgi:predicted Abi (CAAX) family protease
MYDQLVQEPKYGGVSETAPTYEPDYPGQVVENYTKEQLFPVADPLKQWYYVDLPWPLNLVIGRLRFDTQEDAQAFVDRFIDSFKKIQVEAFPVASAGLFGSVAFMTMKHPAEMQGVIKAVGETVTGLVKGIGEVIPG